MAAETVYDYYYGDESSQFSFYRIPRRLITGERFKRLSTDAKLLYGLLLDRMGLSPTLGNLPTTSGHSDGTFPVSHKRDLPLLVALTEEVWYDNRDKRTNDRRRRTEWARP